MRRVVRTPMLLYTRLLALACQPSIFNLQSPPTVKLLPQLRPYVGIGVVALGLGLLCCTAAWLGTGV